MKEIHFNEFGLLPDYPQELHDAQREYWRTIEPYLDKMTMTEARAMLFYVNMDCDMSAYLIMRGIKARESKSNIKENL